MAGLYLHIPFCRHACSYCSFYFSTQQNLIEAFVEALIKEVLTTPYNLVDKLGQLKTLYFGGGTPSLLSPEQLKNILDAIYERFDCSEVEELSFEINPENAQKDYLTAIKALGVNRLSMGVQSFHPHILRSMHRSHTKEQALEAIKSIQEVGFNSYNIDLIYAYPAETIEELKADLDTFIGLNPPHISAYSLTVEPGTRLQQLIDKEKMQELDEDLQATHFEMVSNSLKKAGYMHYETSNFAKSGQESKHNSNYWSHKNYLGFGPASHSFLWDDDLQGARRWATPSDLNAYIARDGNLEIEDKKELSTDELAEERLMLALRTKEGLRILSWIEQYFSFLNKKQLLVVDSWVKQGLADEEAWNKGVIKLTDKSFAIADHMVYKLVTAS